MDRSGTLRIRTPWARFPSPNLADRSSTPYTRFNKILRNTFITFIFTEPNLKYARTVN